MQLARVARGFPMPTKPARPAIASSDVTLSAIPQSALVVASREFVNGWPLVGAGGFLNVARSDSETKQACDVLQAAQLAAIELSGIRDDDETATRLRALNVVLSGAG